MFSSENPQKLFGSKRDEKEKSFLEKPLRIKEICVKMRFV